MNLNSLEMNRDEMRNLNEMVLTRILDFYDGLSKSNVSEPVWKNVKEECKRMIEWTPPETGTDLTALLDALFEHDIPQAMNFPHPGFMSYFPSTGLFQSTIAEFIVGVTNRYVGLSSKAPFLAQIESNVIRWFASIIGYPKTSKGILTSGGSVANLSAIIAARDHLLKGNFGKGVIYFSDQTHHSIPKGAHCAGFQPSQIRVIPSREDLSIDTDVLRLQIQKDKENGQTPFMIVGNAGTTNAGTIDPLIELQKIARESSAWFHVDAAYGGFFALTKNGKQKLAGIELADSVIMNPLKSLFLPFGTGALLVKDGAILDQTFSFSAGYFNEQKDDLDFWDSCGMSLEMSKSCRGLRVWLPVKMHGIKVFRNALEEKLSLARELSDRLEKDEKWDVLYKPQLSVLVLSARVNGKSQKEIDKINELIIEHVKAFNRVYLTGTTIKGRFLIRVCVLNLKTHHEQLDWLCEDLNRAYSKVV